MRRGGKTAAGGDFVQAQVTAEKKLMRFCQADVVQVFQKGGSGSAVKNAAEMIPAHMSPFGGLLQADRFIVMTVDKTNGGDNFFRNAFCRKTL